MSEYYVIGKDNKEYGPYSQKQIKELYINYKVHDATKLRKVDNMNSTYINVSDTFKNTDNTEHKIHKSIFQKDD